MITMITQVSFCFCRATKHELINFTEFYSAIISNRSYLPSTSRGASTSTFTKGSVLRGSRSVHTEKQDYKPKTSTALPILALDASSSNRDALENSEDLSTEPESKWGFLTQLPEKPEKEPVILAHQAMAKLRQRLHRRTMEPEDLVGCAQICPVPMIEANAFAERISQLGFKLSKMEFLKIWKRFDPDSHGRVSRESILRHLCLDSQIDELCFSKTAVKKSEHRKCPSAEDLITWLTRRFRTGFRKLLAVLAKSRACVDDNDSVPEHLISTDAFAKGLKCLHLPELSSCHVRRFFDRFGMKSTSNGLFPLHELLRHFQDRSQAGVAHHLFSTSYLPLALQDSHSASGGDNEQITFRKLEREIISMFHGEFLTFLNAFRDLDTRKRGTISAVSMRSLLKTQFGFDYSEQEFRDILERLPLDSEGEIQYAEFMRHFDSTSSSLNTLFDEKGFSGQQQDFQTSRYSEDSAKPRPNEPPQQTVRRSVEQLHTIIQERVRELAEQVEKRFQEIDVYNSGRINLEQFHRLLQCLHIEPEITLGELRILWPTLFTGVKQMITLHEFLRHFLYNKLDAAYPNSKLVPPRLGDADLRPCSKRLNGVTCLLKDSLRSKIDLYYPRLLEELTNMDTEHSGYIHSDQFGTVLSEMCPSLTTDEIMELTQKYKLKKDGTICYLEMLKPFAHKRERWQAHTTWIRAHEKCSRPLYRIQQAPSLTDLFPRLGMKKRIPHLQWNRMRRSMQKADQDGLGRVDAPVFREILREGTGVYLTDEQVYELLTSLDSDLTGTLPYTRLLDSAEKSLKSAEHTVKKDAEYPREDHLAHSEGEDESQKVPPDMQQ
ncbi:hypothetical protein D915_002267 [Fasciola hepatica]|uniref:EF-hand domain-containing protein n=1 Tax=Fasciola hepatica TaxID=6192 RepID=A0A4E0RXW6_FASHE|nr:hypothetical protein D915_002267 [Fasciola hepatica]